MQQAWNSCISFSFLAFNSSYTCNNSSSKFVFEFRIIGFQLFQASYVDRFSANTVGKNNVSVRIDWGVYRQHLVCSQSSLRAYGRLSFCLRIHARWRCSASCVYLLCNSASFLLSASSISVSLHFLMSNSLDFSSTVSSAFLNC